MSPQRTTTPVRVVLALVVGAFLGGAVIGVPWAFAIIPFPENGFPGYADIFSGVQFGLLVTCVAAVFWLVGLCLIGGPLWFCAHLLGYQRLYHAVLLGYALIALVAFAWVTDGFDGVRTGRSGVGDVLNWQDNQFTKAGWAYARVWSLQMGFVGALVAAVVWRIAYRRSSNVHED